MQNKKFISQAGLTQHHMKNRNAITSANMNYVHKMLDLEIFKIAHSTSLKIAVYHMTTC